MGKVTRAGLGSFLGLDPPSWMGRLSGHTTWRTNNWWACRPSVLVAYPGECQKVPESRLLIVACQVNKCEGKFGWRQ